MKKRHKNIWMPPRCIQHHFWLDCEGARQFPATTQIVVVVTSGILHKSLSHICVIFDHELRLMVLKFCMLLPSFCHLTYSFISPKHLVNFHNCLIFESCQLVFEKNVFFLNCSLQSGFLSCFIWCHEKSILVCILEVGAHQSHIIYYLWVKCKNVI